MNQTNAPIEHARVRLHDGRMMPQLGFGLFKVPPEDAAALARDALGVGYRSLDTAAFYANEEGVGRGLAESGVPRDEVFVTSKLWNDDQGYDEALRAFDASMAKLGLDTLDLYLIHWPRPAQDRYVESWKAFVRLKGEGRVRSIGVSNFLPEYIDRIVDETGETPVVNQIELHPRFQQLAVRDYHRRHAIQLESWSPLGRAAILGDTTIADIARKHGKTPAQIVIRWHLDQGIVTIPKAADRRHMADNIAVGGFSLDAEDMAAIATLDAEDGRIGPDPAEL